MKILAISDFHGCMDVLEPLLGAVKEHKPDVICFCGDVMKGYARGDEWLSAKSEGRKPVKDTEGIEKEFADDEEFLRKFYGELSSPGIPVLAIPGNMDAPKERHSDIMRDLTDKHKTVHLIHGDSYKMGDYWFVGYGGEISDEEDEDFFVQISSRSRVEKELREELDNLQGKKIILLTHSPPLAGKVDFEKGRHKGSGFVAEIIKTYSPELVLCGHAHTRGVKEEIGETVVVNTGALKYKSAALIELDGNINVRFLEI
ncbi:MAG: hypothetical protein A7316_06465 [Candidatus Altiarchaeales archaeon WOR_SM1_86-2]|nr:MAG: hypothetical protein A7316_06465 [Candidatus Altiarchaeales archaeon WOR_SM1_86-2]